MFRYESVNLTLPTLQSLINKLFCTLIKKYIKTKKTNINTMQQRTIGIKNIRTSTKFIKPKGLKKNT